MFDYQGLEAEAPEQAQPTHRLSIAYWRNPHKLDPRVHRYRSVGVTEADVAAHGGLHVLRDFLAMEFGEFAGFGKRGERAYKLSLDVMGSKSPELRKADGTWQIADGPAADEAWSWAKEERKRRRAAFRARLKESRGTVCPTKPSGNAGAGASFFSGGGDRAIGSYAAEGELEQAPSPKQENTREAFAKGDVRSTGQTVPRDRRRVLMESRVLEFAATLHQSVQRDYGLVAVPLTLSKIAKLTRTKPTTAHRYLQACTERKVGVVVVSHGLPGWGGSQWTRRRGGGIPMVLTFPKEPGGIIDDARIAKAKARRIYGTQAGRIAAEQALRRGEPAPVAEPVVAQVQPSPGPSARASEPVPKPVELPERPVSEVNRILNDLWRAIQEWLDNPMHRRTVEHYVDGELPDQKQWRARNVEYATMFELEGWNAAAVLQLWLTVKESNALRKGFSYCYNLGALWKHRDLIRDHIRSYTMPRISDVHRPEQQVWRLRSEARWHAEVGRRMAAKHTTDGFERMGAALLADVERRLAETLARLELQYGPEPPPGPYPITEAERRAIPKMPPQNGSYAELAARYKGGGPNPWEHGGRSFHPALFGGHAVRPENVF